MNRCQHNQKITKFCITPSCNHSQSAGCEYCFKRYHCHIGESKFLKENQVSDLVKYLTAFEDKKFKVRPLKEAIYNYFNIIKGQLSTYIDSLSSDLLNKITYPYLKKQGNLNSFKKLKHKQYNKLTTEEMIKMKDLKESNPPQKLQNEQILAYFDEAQSVYKKVIAINNLYKLFEKEAQEAYAGQSIMSVGIYYKKILEIHDHIQTEKITYSKNLQMALNAKQSVSNGKKKNPESNEQISSEKKKFVAFTNDAHNKTSEVEPKLNQTPKKVCLGKESIPTETKKQTSFQVRIENRPRKSSIDSRCNQLVSSRLKTYEEKQKEISERKQKLEEMMNKKQKKQRKSGSSSGSNEAQVTQDKENSSYPYKSINESEAQSMKNNNDEQMGAHRVLPEAKEEKKLYEQFQAVEKKTLKVPVNVIQQIAQGQQCQSPILKLKKSEKNRPGQGSSGFQLGLFKVQPSTQSQSTHSEPIDRVNEVQSQSSSETSDKENVKPRLGQLKQMTITEKETNSLFLLVESLQLSAKKAIPLLQASLKYAPHNFSAVEYLSYLYLEQNKPRQCLKVCNQALNQISGDPNSIELSYHLFNNKAAALNTLGRFSQSIPILERCIEIKKKDVIYKNLGDSYFNLGIVQKASMNYENALILNGQNHEALYNLGVCLYLQKNYEAAKLKIQKALMIDHQNGCYLDLYKQIGLRIQEEKSNK